MPRHRSRSCNHRRSRSARRRPTDNNENANTLSKNLNMPLSVLTDILKATLVEQLPPPSWRINCQLAHGSPTAVIRDYHSVPDLYKKIADAFDISSEDIIFSTVNTFKPDMENLFNGCIMNDDFLYVHVAGQACELEVEKTQPSLGITISENAVSRCFIKSIAESSIMDKLRPNISVGQQIRKINGVDVIGLRHYEIARMLRLIPIDSTFSLSLAPPLQYQKGAQPQAKLKKMEEPGEGTRPIKIKPKSEIEMEPKGQDNQWITKMNNLLEMHLGIHDDQLAIAILELAKKSSELANLTNNVNESDLAPFKFPNIFLTSVWELYNNHKLLESQ